MLKYKSILNSTGFSGKLEIYNVNNDDFNASYNCVVENVYGKSSKVFYLRRREFSSSLYNYK